MVAQDLPAEGVARRFFLGDLEESEQSALEQRLIESGEVQDRLALLESELVDDYLSDRLAPRDRARFERRYLTHAEGVRKVDFARLLRRRMIDGEPRAVTEQLRRPERSRPWRALAASLLVACLAGILSWQTWQARLELEVKEAEIAAAQGRERALAKRLRTTEGKLEEIQSELKAAQTSPAPPSSRPERSALSYLLTPGTLRDAGSDAQTVVLSDASRSVRLELAWPVDRALTYRGVIQTPDLVEVWSAEGLTVRDKGSSTVLILPVPGGVLRPGDYILRLQARQRQAPWESVADYSFRVRL